MTNKRRNLFLAELISIHAPCAGGDDERIILGRGVDISIHAPCGGGDATKGDQKRMAMISIHAPCGGGESDIFVYSDLAGNFQPIAVRYE